MTVVWSWIRCCLEAPYGGCCAFLAWCFSAISKRTLKIKLNHYMAVGRGIRISIRTSLRSAIGMPSVCMMRGRIGGIGLLLRQGTIST